MHPRRGRKALGRAIPSCSRTAQSEAEHGVLPEGRPHRRPYYLVTARHHTNHRRADREFLLRAPQRLCGNRVGAASPKIEVPTRVVQHHVPWPASSACW